MIINILDMYTNTTREAKKIKILFEDQITNQQPFSLKFFAWSTIIEVKRELQRHIKTPPSNMRLFYKNLELSKNGRTLIHYNVKNKDVFVVKMTPQLEDSLGILNPYRIFQQLPPEISQMLQNVKMGFLKGIKPKLTENGTSGTYFLQNQARKVVAIFKPYDEEPFTPNNPRNFVGKLGSQGFRRGILSGESATREVAAYMLNDNYHGVPPTTYVQFYHPSFQEREQREEGPIKSDTLYKIANSSQTKHGSLQAYIPHDDLVCNYGCNVFSVEEVHKIAILDLRILNCDRNQENILVKKFSYSVQTSTGQKVKKDFKLIPIDHGLSMPDNLHIYDHEVIWMDYPQVRQPFSEKQLQFIEAIDPIKDCNKLKQTLGFRELCLRNFRISQTLLKMAASMGFTIHDIGRMLYRKQPQSVDSEEQANRPKDADLSQIEKLIHEAENIYFIVKENGIKSTVEFQIGLLKPRDSYTNGHKNQMIRITSIKQVDESDEQVQKPNKKVNQPNKRAISMPSIRKSSQQELPQEKAKDKQKQKQKGKYKHAEKFFYNRQAKLHNQEWDDLFFHYFEDILKRYLKKKQGKNIKRNRFRSEFIQQ